MLQVDCNMLTGASQDQPEVVWVGTSKGLIRVYNPESQQKLATLAGHTGECCSLLEVGCSTNNLIGCRWRVLHGTIWELHLFGF